MIRVRDSLFPCGKCGAENFLENSLQHSSQSRKCWSCGTALHAPMILRLERDKVALSAGSKIYLHHVQPERRFDFTQPVAEVVPHPSARGINGLKNTSTTRWNVHTKDSGLEGVDPGRSVTLSSGVRI